MRPPGGGASPAMSFTRDGYESVCAHFQPSHADSARPPQQRIATKSERGKLIPCLKLTGQFSVRRRKKVADI